MSRLSIALLSLCIASVALADDRFDSQFRYYQSYPKFESQQFYQPDNAGYDQSLSYSGSGSGSGSVPSVPVPTDPSSGGGSGSVPSDGGSYGGGSGSVPSTDPTYGGGSGGVPSSGSGSGSVPSVDPSGGGIPTVPSTGGGIPTVPSTGGGIPTVPSTGSSPTGGCSCDFWAAHASSWPDPLQLFSTISAIFGGLASNAFGPSTTLLSALQTRRTDPFSQLLRQGTAAMLNSYARPHFQYTPQAVRYHLNAALVSPQAAAAQAAKFANANRGYGTATACT